MKKAILLLVLCAFLFSSCSFGKSGANAPDDPPIPDSYDESLNDNLWVQDQMKYLPSFQISEEYEALIGDQSRIEAFQKQFEQFGSGGTRDQYEYNVYTLISENGIPKETFVSACEERYTKNGFRDFSDSEIDLLYSDNAEEVYRHFASPFAVFVGIGKEVYEPGWLATHSAQEYRNAGITSTLLWEKLPMIHTFCALLPSQDFNPENFQNTGPLFSKTDTTVPDVIEQRFLELQELEGIPEEQRIDPAVVFPPRESEQTESTTPVPGGISAEDPAGDTASETSMKN